MKILLTIGDITLKGGAERVVANLANAYAQIGLDVEILSFYKSGDKEAFELDNRVKLSYMHQKSFDKKRKNFFYKMFYKFIESYILKRDFKDKDFIIFNNSPHFPLFKNKNTKYIRINHTASKGRYLKRYDYFDTLVLIATGEIDFWKKHHKSVAIIPNFLPNISNLNTNYSQKVVVSVGRLSKEKGFLRLIDIWKLIQDSSEFKDWKLHIVGDGELKEKIENKIKDLNLTNSIILKPFTKDVESEYLSASIYAMTSHFEGFGMVLIEAQSYALPTISFDIATGPRDIIEDDKSGYLIKDNDLNKYATKLKTLMQDESLRAKMGAKSKEIVKSKFSKEVVMKQWMELFERIKNNA
ncbi:MAG: glycosyltransferase family 4 protein [Campylobacter sp.]|uniref:glycosyltransferase family 4 protein n=1 Tax=Campylobacter sp. TaxID=205 RepID=UPI001B1B8581|nr:glycosyltransferase family 4 protein [Campylobacter sp.]MBO5063503.1 glycosyltransferase family 4 protein [Campylobacter sp.]